MDAGMPLSPPPSSSLLLVGLQASSAIASTSTSTSTILLPLHLGRRRRRRNMSSSFFCAPRPWPAHMLTLSSPSSSWTPLNVQAFASKVKKKGKQGSSSSRDWSYEHLMVIWDEIFEQCCCDTAKSSRIRDLAEKGLRLHGRGCVFVFQEIQTIPRGSGSGFTSKPPRSSRRVPEFITLDFSAAYLPREFLLNPSKAPLLNEDDDNDDHEGQSRDHLSNVADMKNHVIDITKEIDVNELISDDANAQLNFDDDEEISASDSENEDFMQIIGYNEQDAASVLGTGYNTMQHDDSLLVFDEDDKHEVAAVVEADDSLPIFEEEHDEIIATVKTKIHHSRGITDVTESVTDIVYDSEAKTDFQDTAIVLISSKSEKAMENQVAAEGDHVDLITREKLFLSMKGMDLTRLLSLTANFDFEAAKSGRSNKKALVDMKTMDAGGEDPYNPENGELVLLLHVVTDKRPTFGADVVIANKHDIPNAVGDEETHSWKLKLKCQI